MTTLDEPSIGDTAPLERDFNAPSATASMRRRAAELAALKQAIHDNDGERQHAKGKLTVRERV